MGLVRVILLILLPGLIVPGAVTPHDCRCEAEGASARPACCAPKETRRETCCGTLPAPQTAPDQACERCACADAAAWENAAAAPSASGQPPLAAVVTTRLVLPAARPGSMRTDAGSARRRGASPFLPLRI